MAELQNSSKSTVTENLDKISQLQDAHDIQVLHSMSHFANTANSAINQLKENVANEQKSVWKYFNIYLLILSYLDNIYLRIH